MAELVRSVDKDELPDYFRNLRTAFLMDRDPTAEQVAWSAKGIDLDRTLGAFADGALRATARSFPVELTVPGGSLTAAAVTQVTVAPTHRRRGLLTAMMSAQLSDFAERGEPIAILVASEWPIYGRFGYGLSTERVELHVDTKRVRFREPGGGRVTLVEPDELRRAAPGIYDRAVRPGRISRDERWWDGFCGVDPPPGYPLSRERVYALWSPEGGSAEGYVVYDPRANFQDGRPEGQLSVVELMAATPAGYGGLWRFLCEVDLVTSLQATNRPVDDPLQYLLADGRAVRQRSRSDHLWLRLIDPPAALAGRRYRCADRLVLEVSDPFLGRGGLMELEGGPDGARCDRLGSGAGPADLVLGISALGAVYLGGTTLAGLGQAGLVTEGAPGALARADAMFGVQPAPFLTTTF